MRNPYTLQAKRLNCEANIQPENTRSIHLVKNIGFKLEGYSPKYLKINDKWCDHERWALLNKDVND